MPYKIYPEAKFKKWFVENAENLKFSEVKKEVPLYGAYQMLEYSVSADFGKQTSKIKHIGRIDLTFTHKGKDYVCEVKYYPFGNSEFWDCLKVLGYTAYYNWQNNSFRKPCVMLPREKVKLEHFITAQKLNLVIFGIKQNKDSYEVKLLDAPDYKTLI